MPDSIQEWLRSLGFSEFYYLNPPHFGRPGSPDIPFTELAGHSVASFREKAKRKGWITEEEARATHKPPSTTNNAQGFC